ncbi:hypothetical protein HPB52_011774 [Rhipicephalus sanguineus]|uniref:Uncharacterized protein n=1 Tax=Rhipicephalus sanguineus TaxID=34632 RepID=A0A9D4PVR0_RHISA|nr:hypothetical protein HPB52_011774 [Rhipicephalus sanguineus]
MTRLPGVSEEGFMESLEKFGNDKHALGRIGTPEEVAHSIAFLASDDAAFVTGITMPVEGGMLLLSPISDAPEILCDCGHCVALDNFSEEECLCCREMGDPVTAAQPEGCITGHP